MNNSRRQRVLWSKEDDKILKELFDLDYSTDEIASVFKNRSKCSIFGRAKRLGLFFEERAINMKISPNVDYERLKELRTLKRLI